MMLTGSLDVTLLVSFAMGMLSSIRVNIGFIYMSELMPASKQVALGSFWNILEGSIYVVATFYFWKISTDWFFFVAIGYSVQLFSVFAFAFWKIPESPRYLLEVQDLDGLRESLEVIAQTNGRELVWDPELFRKTQPKLKSDALSELPT